MLTPLKELIDRLEADFKRLDSGHDWTEWQDVRDAITADIAALQNFVPSRLAQPVYSRALVYPADGSLPLLVGGQTQYFDYNDEASIMLDHLPEGSH